MKASELIKHLKTISDNLEVDPDVVVETNDGVFHVRLNGMEGQSSEKDPTKTLWAKVHLKTADHSGTGENIAQSVGAEVGTK
jgi:hypothetical protein